MQAGGSAAFEAAPEPVATATAIEEASAEQAIAKPRRGRKPKAEAAQDDKVDVAVAEVAAEPAVEKPKRSRAKAKAAIAPIAVEPVIEVVVEKQNEEPPVQKTPEPEPVAVVLTPPDPDRPKRGGWWRRG